MTICGEQGQWQLYWEGAGGAGATPNQSLATSLAPNFTVHRRRKQGGERFRSPYAVTWLPVGHPKWKNLEPPLPSTIIVFLACVAVFFLSTGAAATTKYITVKRSDI